jgi:hypothetical protein
MKHFLGRQIESEEIGFFVTKLQFLVGDLREVFQRNLLAKKGKKYVLVFGSSGCLN